MHRGELRTLRDVQSFLHAVIIDLDRSRTDAAIEAADEARRLVQGRLDRIKRRRT